MFRGPGLRYFDGASSAGQQAKAAGGTFCVISVEGRGHLREFSASCTSSKTKIKAGGFLERVPNTYWERSRTGLVRSGAPLSITKVELVQGRTWCWRPREMPVGRADSAGGRRDEQPEVVWVGRVLSPGPAPLAGPTGHGRTIAHTASRAPFWRDENKSRPFHSTRFLCPGRASMQRLLCRLPHGDTAMFPRKSDTWTTGRNVKELRKEF